MMGAAPRYLLVGVSCAVLYNVALIAGDLLGLHYVVTTAIAYVVVVLWGYGLHSLFTFGRELSARALFRYALGMAVNLPLSLVLMFLFCDVARVAVVVAAPATTVILFVWNFVTSRWAILVSPALAGISPRSSGAGQIFEGGHTGWPARSRLSFGRRTRRFSAARWARRPSPGARCRPASAGQSARRLPRAAPASAGSAPASVRWRTSP